MSSTQESKQFQFTKKAVELLQKKGYKDIKADLPDFDQPTRFTEKNSDKTFAPDLTAETLMGKDYFKIVEGDKENMQEVVSKWKLFSSMAKLKNGKFFLLVPYGKKKYTAELVKEHNIDAQLLKLEAR